MNIKSVPRFSVVIPTYNAAKDLATCVASVLSQDIDVGEYEVIIADDCSSDETKKIAEQLAATADSVVLTQTIENGGPGAARNAALEKVQGEWVIFLDSDDALLPNALSKIKNRLRSEDGKQVDVLAFDWEFGALHDESRGGRTDADFFGLSKKVLLSHYLSLHMDGSVIYVATRTNLIRTHGLTFARGYHEDVDFLFRVFYHATAVGYLGDVIYRKNQRKGSIVNTIGPKHLLGFLRAWKDIGTFLEREGDAPWLLYGPSYMTGLSGVVATRVREIHRKVPDIAESSKLYRVLHEALHDPFLEKHVSKAPPKTKYEQIARLFTREMSATGEVDECKAKRIGDMMRDMESKSWSCVDLHHSVFLAPDQVRTCCKRFFIDGQMKGDVALIDIPETSGVQPSAESILEAKRRLHLSINRGQKTDCDGCPFLEFKAWEPLTKLDVRYLSLEHHSVCNLQCSYCSDVYYGGLKPRYDVPALVDGLVSEGILNNCSTVVWGGGEPTSGKGFAKLLERVVEAVPAATHRVLTNAVTYSKAIQRLLDEGRICITTSVDAGNEAKFLLIRGRPKLRSVMTHLQKYSKGRPHCVTVKYIFTEDNHSLDDVRGFVKLVKSYELTDCNFQISSDFKKESIAQEAVISMVVMYGLLNELGCRVIFFDDLLRHRLTEIASEDGSRLQQQLAMANMSGLLADPKRMPSIAVWGAGWLAKYLMEKSRYCKEASVEFFVDSTPSKIGTTFMGKKVYAPEVLRESNIPVAIAACQSLPIIYRKYMDLGISQDRLVRQLII